MNLALFDLDNTLLPLDSDHGWSDFLARKGAIDAATFKRRNDEFYEQYKIGQLNIQEFLKFQLGILARFPRAQLNTWHTEFMQTSILPNIRQSALDLVRKHQAAGDLCAVVTATNHFVTRPIVDQFNITHLIATNLEELPNGDFTGNPSGTPSFREGKITRVNQWLHEQNQNWQDFSQTWFYSDSINDLALLEQVSHPVAVNPDEKLLEIAQTRAWQILHLFSTCP